MVFSQTKLNTLRMKPETNLSFFQFFFYCWSNEGQLFHVELLNISNAKWLEVLTHFLSFFSTLILYMPQVVIFFWRLSEANFFLELLEIIFWGS